MYFGTPATVVFTIHLVATVYFELSVDTIPRIVPDFSKDQGRGSLSIA